MVYGLGNKGMQLLGREDAISRRKLDWTARNRSVTRLFMEHALVVADAMTALELSCRSHEAELVRYHSGTGESFKWSVPSVSPAQLPRLASSLTGCPD
jgi:hypothetical protein